MQITVRLLAGYRCLLLEEAKIQGSYLQDVPPGTPVSNLLAGLPIPPADVYTFFVNGRHAERDRVLRPGDVVSVFPAAGGG